jgi:hypothetical protein
VILLRAKITFLLLATNIHSVHPEKTQAFCVKLDLLNVVWTEFWSNDISVKKKQRA